MNKKGFTLVELLVVIAIIGLLSTIAVVSLSGARSKATVTKIVADLRTVQTALEAFATDNNGYPAATAAAGSWSALSLGTYMPKLPTPTGGGGYMYCRSSDGSAYLLLASTTVTVTPKLAGLSTVDFGASGFGAAIDRCGNTASIDGGLAGDFNLLNCNSAKIYCLSNTTSQAAFKL